MIAFIIFSLSSEQRAIELYKQLKPRAPGKGQPPSLNCLRIWDVVGVYWGRFPKGGTDRQVLTWAMALVSDVAGRLSSSKQVEIAEPGSGGLVYLAMRFQSEMAFLAKKIASRVHSLGSLHLQQCCFLILIFHPGVQFSPSLLHSRSF